ncbi:Amidohydrolase [Pigmentiphaga humi]|uniref:Amidohydrolase n=1 Tax=Pigmentiphaga humi TaxID=2478468 RepID=A0A3P4B1I0_9BURK|nr:amidohydrolase family protein [Pigmentiphaga humi]VCU70139.1 Amidohydrolase [Pigmentiphaga humi]
MKRRVVDIHPHIISPDTRLYPRAPLFGKPSVWSQERPATLEQLIAEMDAAGVAKAAIVHASTCYGFDNGYVADAVAQYPQRFTGVFSVDVHAADAPERIRHWAGRNLTGLRLFTAGSTIEGQAPGLGDPATYPAWDCAAELGIPVCVQMRLAGIPQLRELLARYPELPIILDHFLGVPLEEGPPYDAAGELFTLADHANVHLKLTPVIIGRACQGRADPESFFRRAFDAFGVQRIAWGSNFPASPGSLRDILQDSREALAWASADDLDWVFHKTAEQLYPALRD